MSDHPSASEISSFISDTTLKNQCYYVDLKGDYHYFSKLIRFEMSYKSFWYYQNENEDSIRAFDSFFTSIGYYKKQEDTVFFVQEAFIKTNSFGFRYDSEVLGKYWLAQDISTKIVDQPFKQIMWRRKPRTKRKEVIYSSNETGDVMILGESTLSDSYSVNYTFDIIIGDKMIHFRPNFVSENDEKKLKKYSLENYNSIIEALESNPELSSLFQELFNLALDDAYDKTSERKLVTTYVLVTPILMAIRKKICK